MQPEKMELDRQTFIPGRHKLNPGQILSPDLSAYEMLHTLEAPWPCLSFDVLCDNLGEGRARKKYPATVYAVAGTQAAQGREKENEILILKMSKLSRMDRLDEDSSDDDDDEAVDSDPVLEQRSIRTNSCTNRIRAYQIHQTDFAKPITTYTASMMESGQVLIHNVTPHLSSFDQHGATIAPAQSRPLHTITAHGRHEGYAVDWSPQSTTSNQPAKLLTGDTFSKIHLTSLTPSGEFHTQQPFSSHTSSVEELQWSPSETTVFASASADGTVKIWDTRSKSHTHALSIQISQTDVNVLSWSKQTPYLLASGSDDGVWAAWDLRSWKPKNTKNATNQIPTPVASFPFHKSQITSVEWHPTEDSIVSVAAGDNTVTLWDLAVEHDDDESRYTRDAKDVPPHLLFVHYMETVKECHWHPQAPGMVMATGGGGFGVFRTISV